MITEKIDRYLTEEKHIPGYKEMPGVCGECHFSLYNFDEKQNYCTNNANLKSMGLEPERVGILGKPGPGLPVDWMGYCPRYQYGDKNHRYRRG